MMIVLEISFKNETLKEDFTFKVATSDLRASNLKKILSDREMSKYRLNSIKCISNKIKKS